MTQDIVSKVKFSIYGHGRGWCFTPNDFSSLANDRAVRQALSRLQRSGFIRRLAIGLYEYPRVHRRLGTLAPDVRQVARAIARKDNIQLLPSGAYAANLLGLSEQVPAKAVYLTEGTTRTIKIGKQEIVFKKTTPKTMATAGSAAGVVIQAIRYVGQPHLNKAMIAKLRKRLGADELASLRKNLKYAPAWVQQVIRTELIGDGDG
jgi:hypothetical protein